MPFWHIGENFYVPFEIVMCHGTRFGTKKRSQGRLASSSHQILLDAFTDQAPSKRVVTRWFSEFKGGQSNSENDAGEADRPGPSNYMSIDRGNSGHSIGGSHIGRNSLV